MPKYQGYHPETGNVIVEVGNPGNIPLHESLGAISDWVEYEASVVDSAAEEIEDSDVKEAAEKQADAMEEAAESLEEASEEAADTAAEIYTETGVPSDEQGNPVVAGNPADRYHVRWYDTSKRFPDGKFFSQGYFDSKEKAEEWAKKNEKDLPEDYEILTEKDMIEMGNPEGNAPGADGSTSPVVEGNPRKSRPDSEWYKEGYQAGLEYKGADDAPDPLSGEWAGQSIPEIFGSWEDATDEAMDSYETGYWAAVYGNPIEDIPAEVAENVEETVGEATPEPIQEAVEEAVSEEQTSDVPPAPTDWLFKERTFR